MKLNLLSLTCLSLLSACGIRGNDCNFETRIIFKNQSAEPATVKFTITDSVPFQTVNLLPSSQKDTTLCFTLKLKQDGHYTTKITRGNKDTVLHWGYYTNGTPPHHPLLIELQKDCIRVKEKF